MSTRPEVTTTRAVQVKALPKNPGMSFLTGMVTGILCGLLLAATTVIAWTTPQKAPALGAIAAMMMIILTVVIIALNRIDRSR